MRILLIEDDSLLGDGLKAGLEDSGWVVDWVRDGETALGELQEQTFDMAVLDLGLPKRSGMDVLHTLRWRGNRIPILILTATCNQRTKVTALDGGADDYIVKPFDLEEVCARLRALHRRSLGSASPALRYKDIEIDPATRSVTVAGRGIDLSPKEFAILQVLVENAGKPVLRLKLMMSTYGWDDNIGSNALEVHIHHLRRKIAGLSVKAIRGVGYRLD